MFPFKSYLILINLKFPLSVVLIAIFKPFDNLLPLITFYLPIISLLIYSNWIFIIFCLPIFSPSPTFFSSLPIISLYIYSNWLFIIFCLPLFSLSLRRFYPFQLFLSSNSYFHKNSRYASQFVSYFNFFPSMIIFICRDLVNSTMKETLMTLI